MSSPIEHRYLQQAMSHIDGIDVSRLLHDIGDATARTDQIELFRLCLSAQRVLGQVLASRAGIERLVMPEPGICRKDGGLHEF